MIIIINRFREGYILGDPGEILNKNSLTGSPSSTLFVAQFLTASQENNNGYHFSSIVERLLRLFTVWVSSLHWPNDNEDMADVT